jgi:hypothetical protein
LSDSKIPTIEEMAGWITAVCDVPDSIAAPIDDEIQVGIRTLYDALAEKDALIAEALGIIDMILPKSMISLEDGLTIHEWLEKTKGIEDGREDTSHGKNQDK